MHRRMVFLILALIVLLAAQAVRAGGFGTLRIHCATGVTIYLDDELKGICSQDGLTVEVFEGDYELRAEAGMRVIHEGEVSVESHRTTTVTIGE